MNTGPIARAAAALYSPVLPYHNFGHAVHVASQGALIVGNCARENIPVDGRVVYLACLFHDAGFHMDHLGLGHESKESYSAVLAADLLAAHDLDREVIERVVAAILSTHCDGRCASNEARAVKAADLSGVAAVYGEFRIVSMRLWAEAEMLGGRRLPWDAWREQACERLELFLHDDLHLTSDYFDDQGRSIFHLRARENIRRLSQDPAPEVQ